MEYKIEYVSIAKIKLTFYTANFNSSNKNNCDFKQYHSKSRGTNCQYVGFFDNTYNIDLLNYFHNADRKLLFLDANPTKYYVIDNEEDYTGIDKNDEYTVARLMWQKSDIFIVDKDTIEESYEKSKIGGLDGEHVVVSNIDHKMFTLDIEIPNENIKLDSALRGTSIYKLLNGGNFVHNIVKFLLLNDREKSKPQLDDIYFKNEHDNMTQIYRLLDVINANMTKPKIQLLEEKSMSDESEEKSISDESEEKSMSDESEEKSMSKELEGGHYEKYNKYKNKSEHCEKLIMNMIEAKYSGL